MAKYLDYDGLGKVWARIKNYFGPKYATCSTGRNTAAKVVSYTGFVLQTGARITVKFTDTGTSNPASGNITLNVNSTGAKNVYLGRVQTALTQMNNGHGAFFYNNQIIDFVYDGTNWIMIGGFDTNTTYSAGTGISLSGTTFSNSGVRSITQDTSDGHKLTINTGGTSATITIPDNNTDTKNTAGSTDTSSKIFLIGATSQAANPQTYSHDTAYVGTDGCLYSNSTKVSTDGHTHNYAGSQSAGGPADYVRWSVGSDDASRRVPFAYNDANETTNAKVRLCYDDDFKYNPNTNLLQAGRLVLSPGASTQYTAFRLNRADSGNAVLHLGGAAGTTTGTGDGQWSIYRRGSAAGNGFYGDTGDFSIQNNGVGTNGGITVTKSGTLFATSNIITKGYIGIGRTVNGISSSGGATMQYNSTTQCIEFTFN